MSARVLFLGGVALFGCSADGETASSDSVTESSGESSHQVSDDGDHGGEPGTPGNQGDGDGDGTGDEDPAEPQVAGQGCREARLTAYDAALGGMCPFAEAVDVLPDFVQQNITLAIAEPFAGGSYDGDFAESCGECWEISTISATQIVMVTNLCPANDDNPVCHGPELHFDVSRETAEVLGHEGITITQARPVPCPVKGNIFVVVADRNDHFLRIAFANHRFTIRTAEIRLSGTSEWTPMERDGGAWAVYDQNPIIGSGTAGADFRLTTPTGVIVESTAVFPPTVSPGEIFDIGVQFADQQAEGRACVYVPDGTVYDDALGGDDPVNWEMRAYGGAEVSESSSDCAAGSSCVHVTNYARHSGAVFRINDPLPKPLYSTLSAKLKATSGQGQVEIVIGQEGGESCDPIEVNLTDEVTTVDINLADFCSAAPEYSRIAFINQTEPFDLMIDDVVFE